jgi:CheY-like chemotaxis protein
MPEMDGYELIRELHKQSHRPKIIAMSGGSDKRDGEVLLHVAKLMRVDRILSKPIDSAVINSCAQRGNQKYFVT